MKPQDRIEVEVEPLGEARWARIEERVFEVLDAPGEPGEPGEPSEAGEFGATEAPAPSARTPRAKESPRRTWVLAASGFAVAAAVAIGVVKLVSPAGEAPAPLHVAPLHVATGDGAARAPIGVGSELEVGPQSEVVATGDDARGVVVVLERGWVTCDVAPRASRPPFVVQAGDVRVRVVGTKFRVERQGRSDVRVVVTHGRVEVSRGGETQVVTDGEVWPRTPPTAATSVATLAPPPPPVPATITPAPSTAPSPTTSVTDANAEARRQYEAAARSEVSDPAAAMAGYRRVAAGGGPWAAPALYAAGRLAADRGDRPNARALLSEYLRRFPHGANAADARTLLARLD